MVLKWLLFIIITLVMWTVYYKYIAINTKEFKKERRLDERQLRIRLEILSNTFGYMFLIIMSYIAIKLSGLNGNAQNVFTQNPEILFIVLLGIIYAINVLIVKKKYS
ncbi:MULTISPECIES: hypothetical protein [Mammaliicoccus]|uniref:DUF3784 domain-containing protein n=1 Tax=Mammaliicoccus fleurettii TaxID=150056 RepID=A0ABS5MPG7_9STAP|nr:MULTISPECIES: hypothetical protein [Mammaliicoccus]HCN59499.1 hypothetical protein [Staphylococcus sp.]MBL0848074.1 hypothetical protein [Mammaliicoccus fleurettii]MBS3672012.1 hypothetical protein [Mammaliicoccus fleurettii]MBS3697818.1 hypothetical protein [Mammaliicoccus fleurettii]MBW0765092.1 hypothetical protein [Mammaliicoccus fleurettii]